MARWSRQDKKWADRLTRTAGFTFAWRSSKRTEQLARLSHRLVAEHDISPVDALKWYDITTAQMSTGPSANINRPTLQELEQSQP